MATRTIANGGGNWNATGTWVEGAIPTAADDVVATGTSGNVTIPASTTGLCRSANFTNYVGTLTFAATTSQLTIGTTTPGPSNVALLLSAGMTLTLTGVGALNFVSTSTTQQTVTTNGKILPGVSFNAGAGSWLLTDAMTAASTISHPGGTLNTGGYSVTATSYSCTTGTAKTLTPGASTFTLSAVGAWQVSSGSLVISSNTATVYMSATNVQVALAALNYNGMSFVLTGPGTAATSGAATIGNFTRTGTASKTDVMQFLTGGLTITGTLTLTGNSAINRLLASSTAAGGAVGINAAAVSLTNVDFMDIVAGGAASPWSGTSLGDCWGNSNITFPTGVNRYAVAPGVTSSTSMWSATSGGSTGASVPLPQDDVYFDANSAAGTYTWDMPRLGRNKDFTGFTRTLTFTSGQVVWHFGSVIQSSGMTLTPVNTVTCVLMGRGSHTIVCAGKQFWPGGSNGGLTVNAPGGTYTLGDAFNYAVGSITHTAGTFDTAGYSVVLGGGAISTSGNLVKGMIYGTSTVSFSRASGTLLGLTLSAMTNTTFSGASATFLLVGVSQLARVFDLGGQTLGTITYTVDRSPGTLQFINNGGTINTLNIGPARQVIFNSNLTINIGTWNGSGEAYPYLAMNGQPHSAIDSISTPDATVLRVAGDITLDAKLSFGTWAITNAVALICKMNSGANVGYCMRLNNAGRIELFAGGGQSSSTLAISTVFGPNDIGWVRAVWDDAANQSRFYTSPDGTTWTQLGPNVTHNGTGNSGTDPFYVGQRTTGNDTSWALANAPRFYRARVYSDTTQSTVVFDADFSLKPWGANTFTESSPNAATVTIGGFLQRLDGRLEVVSSVAATPHTIVKTGGGTVSLDYLKVQDSTASPSSTWYAGANSQNVSGNTGWIFTVPPVVDTFVPQVVMMW